MKHLQVIFIRMLLNNKLLIKISKFRVQRFEKRSVTPFDVKSFCYSNSPNVKFLSGRETNGCRISFPLYSKFSKMKYGYNMSQLSDNICWKCKESVKVKNFCCVSCGALQHPNPKMNYFQLLGVSQTFDVDLEDLKKKFMNLQMTFHPDKFVNKSQEEKEISQAYSTLINKAYTTVKNPLARGFYLLEVQKIPTDNFLLKQDFLFEIMEKNEELETTESTKDLETFLRKNQDNIDEHLKLVKDAFHRNRMDDVSRNLSKLNYFVRLDDKIKEKLNKNTSDPSSIK